MTDSNIKEMFKMMDTCVSAVDQLRTDMNLGFEEVKTELSQVKTDVSQLKSDVSGLKSDVSVLKTDVAEIKTELSELNKGQIRLETGLGKNNRLVDKLAGEMMRMDIRVGRLEDATV